MELHQVRHGCHPCLFADWGEVDGQLPEKVGDEVLVQPIHHAAEINLVPRKGCEQGHGPGAFETHDGRGCLLRGLQVD